MRGTNVRVCGIFPGAVATNIAANSGVTGEIQMRNYDDKDGNKRTAVDVIADEVEFLSRKGESTNGGDYAAPAAADAPADGGEEMRPVTDDSLPF